MDTHFNSGVQYHMNSCCPCYIYSIYIMHSSTLHKVNHMCAAFTMYNITGYMSPYDDYKVELQ